MEGKGDILGGVPLPSILNWLNFSRPFLAQFNTTIYTGGQIFKKIMEEAS